MSSQNTFTPGDVTRTVVHTASRAVPGPNHWGTVSPRAASGASTTAGSTWNGWPGLTLIPEEQIPIRVVAMTIFLLVIIFPHKNTRLGRKSLPNIVKKKTFSIHCGSGVNGSTQLNPEEPNSTRFIHYSGSFNPAPHLPFPLPPHHSRQLDAHEGEAAGEADQDAGEADADEHHTVAARRGRVVGAVQQDEAQAAHGEQERRRQALHDVLAVDAVRQERNLMWTRHRRADRRLGAYGVYKNECAISDFNLLLRWSDKRYFTKSDVLDFSCLLQT